MIGVFFFYQILQHIFGPRFFLLSIFFPAPHKYLTPIKDVKKSDNNEEQVCPICYGELSEDPTAAIEEVAENADNQQPLRAKPLKKCMGTPCKHYYHPSC